MFAQRRANKSQLWKKEQNNSILPNVVIQQSTQQAAVGTREQGSIWGRRKLQTVQGKAVVVIVLFLLFLSLTVWENMPTLSTSIRATAAATGPTGDHSDDDGDDDDDVES